MVGRPGVEITEYNDQRVVDMRLPNQAVCQITAVADDPLSFDQKLVGFLVRVWEPWGVYPGEPDGQGGYQDGTGHNMTCLSFIIRFTDEGAPVLEDLDVRLKHYRPEGAEHARLRREKAQSDEAKRERMLAEAESLERRARELREKAPGGLSDAS